ncbi:hypothetical protein NIES4071_109780 (plasmid) [Calothrix sp. NIES-4071]|nr:hypothetical protein NIES4071_109780 [Calothrix sp. NIES-4071]BAZ65257.1 hypothetical protein NIES4105_109900 [Calothrix sp. NIES-4105]
MRRIKALVASITLLSGMLIHSNADAQDVRHVVSSCHVETTAGVVERGRCDIKTWAEGDYIIVEIRESWNWSKEPTYFRLVNYPGCSSWRGIGWDEDNCKAVEGDGKSWSKDDETGLVSFGEYKDEDGKGNPQVIYTYGRAYTFFYHGPFPRPNYIPEKFIPPDLRNQAGEDY